MPENPYKYTGPLDPVKDRLVCIPRTAELQRVAAGIQRGDYWVVQGPWHIGKSTFLRQVSQAFPDDYHINLDLTISPRNEAEFYNRITQQFLDEIPHKSVDAANISKIILEQETIKPDFAFYRFLGLFKPEENKRVIIFCDEVEKIDTLKSFLQIWQKVFHERYSKEVLKRYTVIIAGATNIGKFASEHAVPFNFAETLRLTDFSYEESRQLIDKPFKELNISIAEQAEDKLIARLNGHPQMLQQSCRFLAQRGLETGKELGEADAADAFKDLFEKNSALHTLKRHIEANVQLRDLILKIVAGERIDFLQYREFSTEWAGPIVEGPDQTCAIRNDIFKEFLKRVLPPVKTVSNGEIIDIPRREPLIKKESKNRFDFHPQKPMPCAVKQIQVRDYHGIISTDISLPVDARWILLTGENAYGKTALLRALAIGLYGPVELKRTILMPDEKSRIAVEIYRNGVNQVNNVGAPDFEPFTLFAAYGPSRLEIQSDRTMKEISGKSAKTYSLFNDDGVSLNIERELLLWKLKKEPKFDIVKNILLELLPHGADIEVDEKNNEVLYIEKESAEEGGAAFKAIRFGELAAGNKSIISMIGDLLVRFYEEYESTDTLPKEFEGIVIIDELDLHLHPKWLWRLPGILSRLFPKIQFIASTHSEIPILGAPQESIFLKVTRTQKEGIQVQRLPLEVKNLLSHHILTSPIFDLEEESISAANGELSEVRTEDSYREIREMDKMKEELRAFAADKREILEDLLDTD